MEMTIDHRRHLVSVWLANDEKDVAILEPVYRHYRGTAYQVVVLRSGMGDLQSGTAGLLRANRA